MKNSMRHVFLTLLATATTVSSPFVTGVRAGSVVPMTLDTMSDHAGQVIMGTVASVHSYRSNATSEIESRVIFTGVTYLKGASATREDTFALVVPGGRVGDSSLQVSCTPSFKVGDKWLLFLLPTYKTFPVVGLSNGAFRVRVDENGTERVFNVSMAAVSGVSGRGFVQVERNALNPNSSERTRLIDSAGARVTDLSTRGQPAPAISLDEFLAILKPILSDSAKHDLIAPAGRRENVTYTPVPLVRTNAPSQRRASHTTGEARTTRVESRDTLQTRARLPKGGVK